MANVKTNKIQINFRFVPGYGIYGSYHVGGTVKQIPQKISEVIFFKQDKEDIKILCTQHLFSNNLNDNPLSCFNVTVKQDKIKTKTKITGLKSKAEDIFVYKTNHVFDDSYALYVNAELIHLSEVSIVKELRKSEGKSKLQGYNYCLSFKWDSNIGTFTKRVCYDTEHYNTLIRIAKDKIHDHYQGHGYQFLHDIDIEIAMLQTLKNSLEEAMRIWKEYSGTQIYEYLKTREIINTIEEEI